jgi:hypothetical protein
MRAAAPDVTTSLLALCLLSCGRRAPAPRSPDACRCEPARFAARPVVWGAPLAGLRLGVAVDGTCVQIRIENTGARPLLVFSHVYGGARPDLEGYTLRLLDAAGAVTEVDLYGGPRRESGPVDVTLVPGESVRHGVDVAAGNCYRNMPTPAAPPGGFRVVATYAPRCEPGRWCGRLTAGPAELPRP